MTRVGVALTVMPMVVAVGLVALFSVAARAQDADITTGVVVGVDRSESGGLSGIRLVTSDGDVLEFDVTGETSFGLENAVGDRWVSSDGATDLTEALRRVEDQQRRQQRVTIESSAGVALSVVQARPVSISSNLGYLFAAFAIGWLALVAYVLYLGQRHRSLSQEIVQLRESRGSTRDGEGT